MLPAMGGPISIPSFNRESQWMPLYKVRTALPYEPVAESCFPEWPSLYLKCDGAHTSGSGNREWSGRD